MHQSIKSNIWGIENGLFCSSLQLQNAIVDLIMSGQSLFAMLCILPVGETCCI